jgi:hypothetical protein
VQLNDSVIEVYSPRQVRHYQSSTGIAAARGDTASVRFVNWTVGSWASLAPLERAMVPAVLQAYILVAARLSAKHRSVCAKSQDTIFDRLHVPANEG